VSRGGRDLLPADLRAPEAWEWDFWVTYAEPAPAALLTAYGEGVPVVDLSGADPRLEPLLDLASPSAPIRPGDPRVVRWAAIEDPEGGLPDTGGLAAVLAVTHQRSGAAHLNDVATHPARRGRGLARALCGQVTVDALREGRPAVTLGMYADNDPARRVYTTLGFTCVRGQTSGPL
jgi:ribosomal protein S18 acetylase RimI-like enzyme